MNLADLSPEDIESVELYGATGRTTMTFQAGGAAEGTQATSRSAQQADPTGTLRDRWPPRTPCGREPLTSEQRLGASTVKVIFAAVWLRR
jgi:hypothetical protein